MFDFQVSLFFGAGNTPALPGRPEISHFQLGEAAGSVFTTLHFLTNRPNKLECYITLCRKGLRVKNTLAYWAKFQSKVLWIWSQISPTPQRSSMPINKVLSRNSISPARSHHSRTRSRSPQTLIKAERVPTPGREFKISAYLLLFFKYLINLLLRNGQDLEQIVRLCTSF